jgi:hypothetical protein
MSVKETVLYVEASLGCRSGWLLPSPCEIGLPAVDAPAAT